MYKYTWRYFAVKQLGYRIWLTGGIVDNALKLMYK